jgi:hypothetical protein
MTLLGEHMENSLDLDQETRLDTAVKLTGQNGRHQTEHTQLTADESPDP